MALRRSAEFTLDTGTDDSARSPDAQPNKNNAHRSAPTWPAGGSPGRDVISPIRPAGISQSRDDDADEKCFVDEFGFELQDESSRAKEEQYVRHIDGKMVLRREVKWAKMAADWSTARGKMADKIKERARKGIPSKLRGVAWQLLLGSRPEMEKPTNAGVYMALRAKRLDPEVESTIERDLARTFPTHMLFREVHGIGQTTLRSVLHAYACIDPECGYVQGMGFIVGTLLTQMAEEEAFWCFHTMMYSEKLRLREMFRPGFPMLQMFFYQLKHLAIELMPKLWDHFETQGVDVSYFAAQWFLTIFVYHFHFRAVLRVWDIFMCEGWKIIFRVALALMKWEEKKLMELPFDQLLPLLRSVHEGKDSSEIIERALKVKFKTEDLLKLREGFEKEMALPPAQRK